MQYEYLDGSAKLMLQVIEGKYETRAYSHKNVHNTIESTSATTTSNDDDNSTETEE